MSGCGLQNDYDELYNLLNWAVPGGLGDRHQFQDYYELPMKMAQKKDANETSLGKASEPCLTHCHNNRTPEGTD